jgi:proto-oncogene tyrosine-protein kinase ROS
VTVMSYPEPKPLVLASKSPTSMIISWKKSENISKYSIQYTQQDTIQNVYNATNEIFSNETAYFQIDSLEPKTKYNFTLLLTFNNSNQTYRWTSPEKIEFETDGDRPSPPGRPLVEHVADNVYKVTWNASKDNGAVILEYILESKRDHKFINKDKEKEVDSLRARRSVNENGSGYSADVEPIYVTEMPNEIEDDIYHDEQWAVKYHGVESHWIVTDLNNIEQYIFRVRANNFYGQSDWSLISEFVNNTSHRSGEIMSSAKMTNWLTIAIVSISITFICICLAYVLIGKLISLSINVQFN